MTDGLPVSLATVGPTVTATFAERVRYAAGNGRARYMIGVTLLADAYYGAARLGYELEFAGPVAAVIWLPVGIGIAVLYLGGARFWPGVLAGDLFANNYSALPVGTALAQTCGNMLEMLVAAFLIR